MRQKKSGELKVGYRNQSKIMDATNPGSLGPGQKHHSRSNPRRVTDVRFLNGPQSRFSELMMSLKAFRELISGFRQLHFVGPCVTVFGSARFPETHPHYEFARRVGEQLALAGFTVMTGGGPGIMEAANRGAKDVGGHSVGCNIVLPMEQEPNPYLDKFVDFEYFFIRKLMLAKYSYAFVAMPGGFGTLDELFEIATLVQTRKVEEFPIILAGSEFWNPMIEWLRETMAKGGTISVSDVDRIHISDSPEEIAAIVSDVAKKRFGLQKGVYKRRWWMLE
jgi:uncharacterized protein (TIGR00730 family)